MIKSGQKVRIDPFKDMRTYGMSMTTGLVDGVVKYVHPTHCWFNVEYGDSEGKRLISYKFDEIGKSVRLVKD